MTLLPHKWAQAHRHHTPQRTKCQCTTTIHRARRFSTESAPSPPAEAGSCGTRERSSALPPPCCQLSKHNTARTRAVTLPRGCLSRSCCEGCAHTNGEGGWLRVAGWCAAGRGGGGHTCFALPPSPCPTVSHSHHNALTCCDAFITQGTSTSTTKLKKCWAARQRPSRVCGISVPVPAGHRQQKSTDMDQWNARTRSSMRGSCASWLGVARGDGSGGSRDACGAWRGPLSLPSQRSSPDWRTRRQC